MRCGVAFLGGEVAEAASEVGSTFIGMLVVLGSGLVCMGRTGAPAAPPEFAPVAPPTRFLGGSLGLSFTTNLSYDKYASFPCFLAAFISGNRACRLCRIFEEKLYLIYNRQI